MSQFHLQLWCTKHNTPLVPVHLPAYPSHPVAQAMYEVDAKRGIFVISKGGFRCGKRGGTSCRDSWTVRQNP